MFGRATIRLGIGPHSSSILFDERDKSSSLNFAQYAALPHNIKIVL